RDQDGEEGGGEQRGDTDRVVVRTGIGKVRKGGRRSDDDLYHNGEGDESDESLIEGDDEWDDGDGNDGGNGGQNRKRRHRKLGDPTYRYRRADESDDEPLDGTEATAVLELRDGGAKRKRHVGDASGQTEKAEADGRVEADDEGE